MKVLQTVKYYDPSKGGMESVVKSIVEGISLADSDFSFVVYSNSHIPKFKKQITRIGNANSVKEFTPIIIKSQPLNFRYPLLAKLISDSDIIHHHYPFPNMEYALLRNLEIIKDKKLIITWHANIKNSRWSWIAKYYDPMIKRLLDVASHIIVTSPQLLENSTLLGEYAHKVKVIPLSFEPTISSADKNRSYPIGRKFRLLFVGKLRAYKGVNFLIEAVKDLDIELSIIGNGETKQELIDLVTKLDITNKVSFFTELTDNEVETFYKNSDLFVLPSINEAEAFGVVQLEAMSNGLPVINTNLNSGVPFVSLHNISGLTVEPKNVNELSDAILTIISNQKMYEHFSQGALQRSKDFNRVEMAKSYLNLYGK
ncbi:glycosyltransferase [Pedobacter jeongneungensis]|uniref:glycosyltransferase n=1 Tax=Pedobacter jeongneungensis TaxID=947309 RepID=UPI000468A495|nr:glycosyltransferase [Pedobacter jeongneungensis]